MSKTMKRFLSLLMAFVMVVSVLPATVLASENTLPQAEVTVLDPLVLKAGEYDVWDGSLSKGTVDRPLQAAMNFKANDSFEEAQASAYAKWKCDFYLTFDGVEGGSFVADNSYLAGNYGDYGWIVIPTDGLEVEEGVAYPIVSSYDANLTYENVCDYVKDFTAALYVDPEILWANPDMTVTLALKMVNPEDENDVLVCGEPAVYTVPDLLGYPDATVTVLDPLVLKAGEYDVWDGSLSKGTVDRPLQAAMNFKANDTLVEAQVSAYAKWKCDFYLTFNGMEGGSFEADNSYLAGNYGDYGWIVIPTDDLVVEEGVEYPIVSSYDANLTYENVCDYVKDFTAALYVDPEILWANPDMTVTLALKMTSPDDSRTITIGDPAVYTVPDLLGYPNATVTVLDALTLKANEYDVYDGSLKEGTVDRPLQIAMNFKANDTLAEAQASAYAKWKCDFYLTFDGMAGGSFEADNSYLAGNYGDYGWIVIPTDGMTVEEGVEYPIVSSYDANLTYENICDYVKDFTAALYIAPAILQANRDMTITLALKMTSPDDTRTITVGSAVFKAADFLPNATVTVLDAPTLDAGEYKVYDGSLKEGTEERPLQVAMNFKANDSFEEAQASAYAKWKCDFYLTFDGMAGGSFEADNSYLAGNYGSYGWIVIPTDGMTVEEGVEYAVVSNYDPNLTYENVCDYVKDFTAALYIAPAILTANPNLTVTLKLKMTNPANETDVLVCGEAVFTMEELLYEAYNVQTEKYYEKLSSALSAAKSGQTVQLVAKSVSADLVIVSAGVTLDLNGNKLTATNMFISFGDVIDGEGKTAEGVLVVPDKQVTWNKENAQLPIRTAEGYKFVAILGFNSRVLDGNKYVFQPLFAPVAHELLLNGEVDPGVSIQVRVYWEKGDSHGTQNFVYSSARVKKFIESYNPSNAKYGQMFTLTLNGMALFDTITVEAAVKADYDVIFAAGASPLDTTQE